MDKAHNIDRERKRKSDGGKISIDNQPKSNERGKTMASNFNWNTIESADGDDNNKMKAVLSFLF